jgi:hypothetical protein
MKLSRFPNGSDLIVIARCMKRFMCKEHFRGAIKFKNVINLNECYPQFIFVYSIWN